MILGQSEKVLQDKAKNFVGKAFPNVKCKRVFDFLTTVEVNVERLAFDDAVSDPDKDDNDEVREQALKAKMQEIETEARKHDLIIKKTNPIDERGQYGYTQLHLAVDAGNYKKVKELVKAGASVTIVDNSGKTALDHAEKFAKRFKSNHVYAAIAIFLKKQIK